VVFVKQFARQRWVITFNANLDRLPSQRRSILELRNELKKWEDGRKRVSNTKGEMGGDSVAYQVRPRSIQSVNGLLI
jgi:hypothetical protein